MSVVRRVITARGVVQGVGFRPFVYQTAVALGLGGTVRNGPEGVRIDVEGDPGAVDRLLSALREGAPPLARVERLDVDEAAPTGATAFAIAPSDGARPRDARPPADVAPCDSCRRELADPGDRRHRYPFINCTSCGPRYTIVRGLPYDRARTTMAAFELCAECLREYEDPASRRFHAEPNACARCGPSLRFEWGGAGGPGGAVEGGGTGGSGGAVERSGAGGPSGAVERGGAALDACARALASGAVVAIKGVGGFHLACDARDGAAVRRLRERKRREAKPFALMVARPDDVLAYAHLGEGERAALVARERPVVLLARRPGPGLADEIAPGLAELGFLLPPSPLHELLAAAFGGPLVMTSGNLSGEPIAKGDAEARRRLGAVADAFLLHDRAIAARVDDSVLRVERGVPRLLRRARGYVPDAIALASPAPLLAVGAELKSTFCLATGREAVVSQHLGDLGDLESQAAWAEALASLSALLGFAPAAVACDLHPELASTRYAESLGLPLVRVQHHHAHVAACLAEHGRDGPVVGVAFDGMGYGDDGTAWGGEVLVADRRGFERAARLRPVPMPGGDRAAREPFRMALAYLDDAGEPTDALGGAELEPLRRALRKGVASPPTTSAGRLFDAVAAIAGLRRVSLFEGQAAMELEAASAAYGPDAPPYEYRVEGRAPAELDLRPAVRAMARAARAGRPAGEIGARFHATLAAAVVDLVAALARERGLATAVLTGGCFQNRLFARACEAGLAARGLEALRPSLFPPNDGGLSLGQAAVAAARLGGAA
ncbi:MAG TPA: carbamoyltransferase HypF [Polyangiaceae bacterium]|nr:carbamoyltransferase HypF [Polyangiaceae bacterium]